MLFLTISLIVLLGLVAFLLVSYRRKGEELSRMRMMMQNQSSYTFLIDENFEVKETNYHKLNPGQSKDEPKLLGNVLHCTSGCDAGKCGSGLLCKDCPVRFVITKSFEHQDNFNDLEVSMELYDDNHHPKDVDINMGGRYVNVSGQPYMVLNLKDVSETKRLLRRYIDGNLKEEIDPTVPKVLFAMHDIARYNHLRMLLKDVCRLVYADTPQQVLHRVGEGKDYGYTAVLLDEPFLRKYGILDSLNKHIVIIKLMDDDMTGLDGRCVQVPQDIDDEELKNLLARQFM